MLGFTGRESCLGFGEYLAVLDPHGLQEPLLAERQGDEVTELDELGFGEVLVQSIP